jgi:hypothetical protein
VLQPGASGWPLPREAADWLALLGGFSFSLTNILLRKLQHAPAVGFSPSSGHASSTVQAGIR